MIEKRYELSNENGYKKYSSFTISSALAELVNDDYYLYNSCDFAKKDEGIDLYNKYFIDKYDEVQNVMVFEKYINNENFKNKALFIYALINEKKFKAFVTKNMDLKNPNDYSCEYNIIDSQGVKINMYNLNIVDISFVF